jgi:hypothetical protein
MGCGEIPWNRRIGSAGRAKSLIREVVAGAEIVFLTAGMGGRLPDHVWLIGVRAKIAKIRGAVNHSVVNLPFHLNPGGVGGKRIYQCRAPILNKLALHTCDTLIGDSQWSIIENCPRRSLVKRIFWISGCECATTGCYLEISQLLTRVGEIMSIFSYQAIWWWMAAIPADNRIWKRSQQGFHGNVSVIKSSGCWASGRLKMRPVWS